MFTTAVLSLTILFLLQAMVHASDESWPDLNCKITPFTNAANVDPALPARILAIENANYAGGKAFDDKHHCLPPPPPNDQYLSLIHI